MQNVKKLDRFRGVTLSPIIFWLGFMAGDYATAFLSSPLYSSVATYYWGMVAVDALLFTLSGFMTRL